MSLIKTVTLYFTHACKLSDQTNELPVSDRELFLAQLHNFTSCRNNSIFGDSCKAWLVSCPNPTHPSLCAWHLQKPGALET